jgi:hypothetical protein
MNGFYGRALTDTERAIQRDLEGLNPGQRIDYRNSVTVTRALFGPWFYVQRGRHGYWSENPGTVSAAVHTCNLISAQ